MKKYLPVFCILMALFFTSCGNDPKEDILGYWYLHDIEFYEIHSKERARNEFGDDFEEEALEYGDELAEDWLDAETRLFFDSRGLAKCFTYDDVAGSIPYTVTKKGEVSVNAGNGTWEGTLTEDYLLLFRTEYGVTYSFLFVRDQP